MAEPAMIPVRRPDEGPVEGGELRVVGKVVAICNNQLNIHAAKLMAEIYSRLLDGHLRSLRLKT